MRQKELGDQGFRQFGEVVDKLRLSDLLVTLARIGIRIPYPAILRSANE
jgi:hypothetical protein